MISVVIPVFNSAAHLDRCLKSVSDQSFQDWECILVDDGSTDSSGAICDGWRLKDKRFKCFHQSNLGVSAARNKGIAESAGEYLCFVDADDRIAPDYLESLSSGMAGADLAVSGQVREYPSGKTEVCQPDGAATFQLTRDSAGLFLSLEKKFLLYAPHEKLFLSALIKRHGLHFLEGCSYGEDLLFNFEYLGHACSIGQIPYSGYYYRCGDGSTLSTRPRPDRFAEDYRQWRTVSAFYERHGMRTEASDEYHAWKLWGIVYDGLFLYPKLKDARPGYLRRILSIPEIDFLRAHRDVFDCSAWIKGWILGRRALHFFLFFKLFSRA